MTLDPRRFAAALFAVVLALPAAAPAQAQSFTGEQRGEIERIVKEYLLSNPELLQDVMNELDKRQAMAEAEKHRAAVKEHSAAIFASPRQVTLGNAQGDVTVVEFFDYQCAYCRRVMPSLQAQLRDDGKLRVVFKDFPILGENSVTAARAALAARQQGRYVPFHFALMGASDLSLDGIMAVARSVGIDTQRLATDMNAPEIETQIQANYALARTLGIEGTPAFVIGGELIPGALSKTRLTELIQEARTGCVSC